MQGIDRVDVIMHYCPCCRLPVKLTEGFLLFLQQIAALNNSVLFKKYITNQKGKGYAFEDLILDCVKKMTQSAQREGDSLSTESESLASTSTALTEPLCKQLPVTDVVDHLQGGLKIHKMAQSCTT